MNQPTLPGLETPAIQMYEQQGANIAVKEAMASAASNPLACGSDQLVATMLRPFTRKRGVDALQQARAVIGERGNLRSLSRASQADLMKAGLSEAAAATLRAAFALAARAQMETVEDRPEIHSPADAAALLTYEMGSYPVEHFQVLLLDSRTRVMRIVDLYKGTISSAQVRVSEVFRDAIQMNAAAIIVAHNHPSNDPTPSPDDVSVTRAIIQAGKLLSIDVLDHVVIGGNRWVSLKERGLMSQ